MLEIIEPKIKSTNAKNNVTTLTTIKTEIEAFRICSFVGKITLSHSSLAALYNVANLFKIILHKQIILPTYRKL